MFLLFLAHNIDFKPLAPHCLGLESRQRLLILSCEEAIQLAYGTSVILPRCPLMSEIIQEGHMRSSSTIKAGTTPYYLYCVSVTYNPNKETSSQYILRPLIAFLIESLV
jgi:hypothetical protein